MTDLLELCDELDRLREAATAELPWEMDDSDQEGIKDSQQRAVATTDNRVCLGMFILAACNHSKDLCAEVRRLTAENDDLLEQMAHTKLPLIVPPREPSE